MYVSHKSKIIFLAVPKTASASIRSSLINFCGESERAVSDNLANYDDHVTPGIIKKALNKDEDSHKWKDYFKFAFVRNPWDREISLYNYRIKTIEVFKKMGFKNLTPMQKSFFNFNKRFIKQHPTFESAIKNYIGQKDTFHSPMHKWTHDKDMNQIVDFIGKLENINQDFHNICFLNGLPQKRLKKTNQTKHDHYSSYYTDETREIVKNLYKKDIELFDYHFEEK